MTNVPYEYPGYIADTTLKRIHVARLPTEPEIREEMRKNCDLGDHLPLVTFHQAVRLWNEEGYRACGVCLDEGGERSNWKERAEQAEAEVEHLREQLNELQQEH